MLMFVLCLVCYLSSSNKLWLCRVRESRTPAEVNAEDLLMLIIQP